MRSPLVAFIVRLVLSAGVLWLSVAWVTPANPHNTFGRAVLVSLVLSVAYYLTLAKFFWFLLFPWLVYALIWLAVVMASYGLGFFRALLLALALTILSWVVEAVIGIPPFRNA